jgi:hypothetical protein
MGDMLDALSDPIPEESSAKFETVTEGGAPRSAG